MKRLVTSLVILAFAAAPVAAQRDATLPDGPVQAWFGGGFEYAATVGTFSNYVDQGFGLGGSFVWRPAEGPIGLRIGAMFSQYGSTTRRYNLVGLVNVDVTTRNQIGGLSIGPQLHIGNGALQLYGHGGVGFSYFFTTSSVEGTDQNNSPFASTTNYDDGAFSLEGGGGLLIRLAQGRTPVLLDLGVRYMRNGSVSYVTENTINFNTNPPTVTAITSDANLVIYRLGIMVGLRPNRGGQSEPDKR